MLLNERQLPRADAWSRCANNLVLHDSAALLAPDECFKPHIQRRAVQVCHDENWMRVFRALLSDNDKARFVENGGPLARGWLRSFPVDKSIALKDSETQYALRRMLLSEFRELVFPSGVCLNGVKCKAKGEGGGDGDHPMHHLKCLVNQDLWNNRHTSVKATLAAFIRRVGGSCEVEGVVEGQFGKRMDLVASVPGYSDKVNIDVTVVALPWKSGMAWPTAELTNTEVVRRRGAWMPTPLFFWEDFSEESKHPTSEFVSAFRSLAMDKAVYPVMWARDQVKVRHYR